MCDTDLDGDHILNAVDNCPFLSNPLQTDANGKYCIFLHLIFGLGTVNCSIYTVILYCIKTGDIHVLIYYCFLS